VVGHAAGVQLYGAERSLLSLLAAIDRTRYDVVCTLPASNDEYTWTVRQFTHDIAVFPYSWWSRTRRSDSTAISRFAEFFRIHGVDLVHVNTIN